ncbi:uncharacterized protein L3040_003487 [Drepanopeziza brunnea f. sp. 'multigermtubi']|uniref:uncharacterized protein n=1 Tax=Drepanopeziza brunnea f. sp. 'multigermtubi' TaxID=698441 RepID=UPI00239DA8C7|nr:hypothetical protein L3040_003487 [Drepanopeziza brunnea f. sp. 'multigermtubi']
MAPQPSSDSPPPPPPPPPPPFTYDPSLTPFAVPMSSYLSALPPSLSSSCPQPQAIATGALIFSSPPSTSTSTSTQPQPLLLLLQRAACDSRPHLWEVPGGGVDAADASILHGVAREVREETALTVTHIRRLVPWREPEGGVGGGRVWSSSRGLRIVKFEFEVLVKEGEEGEGVPAVRLDEREHQAFMIRGEGEEKDLEMR